MVDTALQEVVGLKAKVFRQPQSRYEREFYDWFTKLNVKELVSLTQSESDGNVTVTIIYR